MVRSESICVWRSERSFFRPLISLAASLSAWATAASVRGLPHAREEQRHPERSEAPPTRAQATRADRQFERMSSGSKEKVGEREQNDAAARARRGWIVAMRPASDSRSLELVARAHRGRRAARARRAARLGAPRPLGRARGDERAGRVVLHGARGGDVAARDGRGRARHGGRGGRGAIGRVRSLLRRPLRAVYGIVLASNRDSAVYDPRGLGYGVTNLTVIVRRGTMVDTLTMSRLGRVRW